MKLSIVIVFLASTLQTIAQQPTKEQIQQVEDARKEVKSMKGKTFPEFDLIGMNGDTISSENSEGKIVLLNFWFTGCRPCIQEIPELNEMVKEFQSEDIVFVAPTFDDSTQVSKFLKRFEYNYDIVPDVKDFCLQLNIRNYPTHFIINKEGIIEKVMIGYSTTTVASLRKSLKKLLKE
jgi:peroxiredoxin